MGFNQEICNFVHINRIKMKKYLLISILVLFAGASAFAAEKSDTVVVNTTELCKNVTGYNGPTPLIIKVVNGVVVKVEALPNQETPKFFRMVEKGGLLQAPIGLTVEKASTKPYDAVTGATYSSIAVIRNIKMGLKSLLSKE